MDALGIVKLGALGTVNAVKQNGNWIGLVSSYQMADDSIHAIADVWFATQVDGLAQAMGAYAGQNSKMVASSDAKYSLTSGVSENSAATLAVPPSLLRG
jgi:hypothetical protein